MSRTAFRLLSPAKELRNQLEFLTALRNREVLGRREGQRRFLAREGWVAWPGPALREFVDQLLVQNRLLSGGFVVEGETVTLADVTSPILAFVGEADDIARPAAVRAVRQAAPRADIYEVRLDAGHFGLVVGSTAMRRTWPAVAGWLRWRQGLGRRPPQVTPMSSARPRRKRGGNGSLGPFARAIGSDALSVIESALEDGAQAARELAANVINQVPRLARLQGVRRDTQDRPRARPRRAGGRESGRDVLPLRGAGIHLQPGEPARRRRGAGAAVDRRPPR